jgi:dsRNA-specific ribonuclease
LSSALLTAEDAMQHLYHFCDVLPVAEYADSRPMFSFEEDSQGLLRGIITLPNSVHPSVRQARSKAMWRTERAARKDSAFQAYKALHAFGLVNDNLLPLARKPELRFTEQEIIPSIVEGMTQYDPYLDLTQGWNSGPLYKTRLRISNDGSVDENLAICLILPRMTPMPHLISLHVDPQTTLSLSFESTVPIWDTTPEQLEQMRRTTFLYLQAPSSRLRGEERDYVALFVPDVPHESLGEWLTEHDGKESALEAYYRNPTLPPAGIIRDQAKFSEPRIFTKWIVPDVVSKSSSIELECHSLPRRRNLLQMRTSTNSEDVEPDAPKKVFILPASSCDVDKLPAKQAVFGLMISAILDRLEAVLVAHQLNNTILKGVGIEDIQHVITAISTPLAQATTNYQRYEFFGDSVLKFTVSCQLFFRNTKWHEGYLSESRDKLINNTRLARAALDTGIDAFILTNRFTPRKWAAPLIRNKLTPEEGKRRLSSKVLADVVESLIGAAYVDGGIRKAQACLHRFLPEINLFTSDISPEIVPAGKGVSNIIDPHRLSGLIGYTFQDPALLTEALTHASCEYDMTTQSYQRLEFLGDAILDMVVMAVIAAHPVEMDQGPMTLLKHSVVNANLLAFFCMDLCAPDESMDIETTNGEVNFVQRYDQIYLWRFLRSHGPNVMAARESCLERHQGLRDEIHDALSHGNEYPWELFARLRPDKFFSDIIESVLGAIFIDCGGNLDVCQEFVERVGLVWYIQRIIADGVNVVHPRNIAQSMVKGLGTLVFKRKRVEAKGGATYRCSAIVNNTEIAVVEGCASAEEAEVKVANAAIERLKANPSILAT